MLCRQFSKMPPAFNTGMMNVTTGNGLEVGFTTMATMET